MRKILLTAVIAVSLVACNNTGAKKEVSSDSTKMENAAISTAPTAGMTGTNTGAPKFSTPEVQKMADEYTTFVNDYIAAAKSGDATQMQAFSTKAQEWATKMTATAKTMSPEDVKVWTEYSMKLTEEMTKALMK